MKTTREKTLKAARAAVLDRGETYGPPTPLCELAARLWSPIVGVELSAFQVVLCQDAWKTARLLVDPTHADSWADKAGYAAIGAEVAAETLGAKP